MDSDERQDRPRRPGARRRARELALAALYRADLLDLGDAEALAAVQDLLAMHIEDWAEEDKQTPHIRQEAVEYAIRIINGVFAERESIDATIEELAIGWSLERQAVTDRTILRIALWELTQDEPPAVIVNEAVELAREYGGPDSPKFVHGILGARLREPDAQGTAEAAGSTEDT